MSGKTDSNKPVRDRPWMFRTYAGHSTAQASNELYRKNLAKGQTGLSIAFDLPTQTGYDSDSQLARGEVGKVGVPVSHLGDMRTLLDGIPLGEMNTSMTINAPAAWMLSLYVSLADEQGTDRWGGVCESRAGKFQAQQEQYQVKAVLRPDETAPVLPLYLSGPVVCALPCMRHRLTGACSSLVLMVCARESML